MHDPRLLESLSRFSPSKFDGDIFRATPPKLNPLTPSVAGGRWSPRGSVPVLYTSLLREGALAEISFHWSNIDPIPTAIVSVHRIRASVQKAIKLLEVELTNFGVDSASFNEVPYLLTQQIGAAVAFLGYDGLIVPSARWKNAENLMLFAENNLLESALEVVETEQIEWQEWAKAHGFIA